MIVALESGRNDLHYVVLTGLDRQRDIVLKHDPAERQLLKQRRSDFQREWKAAGNWVLLAVQNLLAFVLTLLLPCVSLLRVAEALTPTTPSRKHLLLPRHGTRTTGTMGRGSRRLACGPTPGPNDEPLPVELGGVAFKQKRFAESAKWLRRAMRLNPSSTYAADFLGSIYFLQGNLEAALEIGTGSVSLRSRTTGRARAAGGSNIAGSCLTFAPGGTLLLSDLLTTRARVRGLGTSPPPTFAWTRKPTGHSIPPSLPWNATA